MRLLDLFCGAGGASEGYRRAGFEVVGVDLHPQPHYPFEFHQADALEFLAAEHDWAGDGSQWFDAIHASPPCQFASTMGTRWPDRKHANLIPETRKLIKATGLPYVIENVERARPHLRDPIMVCGSSVGLPLKRHRLFECSFPSMAGGCAHGYWPKKYRIRQHGKEFDTAFCYVFGGGQAGQPGSRLARGDGHRLDDGRRAQPGDPTCLHRTHRLATAPVPRRPCLAQCRARREARMNIPLNFLIPAPLWVGLLMWIAYSTGRIRESKRALREIRESRDLRRGPA